jgi:hypothetical protein
MLLFHQFMDDGIIKLDGWHDCLRYLFAPSICALYCYRSFCTNPAAAQINPFSCFHACLAGAKIIAEKVNARDSDNHLAAPLALLLPDKRRKPATCSDMPWRD